MTRKQSKPRGDITKVREMDMIPIWTAACRVAKYGKEERRFQTAECAAISPFIDAAIELALATIIRPDEDALPLLERARLHLEEAKRVVPAIGESPLLSSKAANNWQRILARFALPTSRQFSAKIDAPSPALDAQAGYEPYATTPAAKLEEPDPSRLWLIEGLWQRGGTGIVGGSAKGAKTWLCLDLALSVASGTPALDKFVVHRPGGVVYVSAEGGEGYVKQRLHALCVHRGVSLNSLAHPLEIIPRAIRIDTPEGLGRLRATVQTHAPSLLVLDPLVRLHRLDENSAASVSGLLSNLTELQQAHDIAIILVHHANKQGARSKEMGGQDFRGSSDFYAWGDSNVFLKKCDSNRFRISAEHRAASATEKWTMEATTGEHPRLRIVEDDVNDSAERDHEADDQRIERDILELIRREGPKTKTELRSQIKGSNDRVSKAVDRLAAQGKIIQVGTRWGLATNGKAHQLGSS